VSQYVIFGLAITALLIIVLATNASAYIGPGVGLTAIGTVIAFVGAIFLAVLGFIWFPIKRLLAKIKKKRQKGV
jgi:hypothetical protein